MKVLPTLYKKTNTGAIQMWSIGTNGSSISTKYGQYGGALTGTTETCEGKNSGKKNETTAEQQATLEAAAKWTKQLKKGYVRSIAAAEADEVDELVEGGIEPMLAQSYAKHSKKIEFNAFVQPKLDGIRSIATVSNGKCTLWSRTRRPITGVPHISTALEKLLPKGRHILDGELYNHDYKNRFEDIVSIVRQEIPKDGHEVVQYHIYDYPSVKGNFNARTDAVYDLLQKTDKTLIWVDTQNVDNEDELMEYFRKYVEMGYEGAMVRNFDSLYEEGKRSYNLQKIKSFADEDYNIVGVVSGRGRMENCAIFVCETSDGKQFNCKMKGSLSELEPFLHKKKLWTGKKLVVQFQGKTADGLPRFPIGVRIRDSVDF